MSQKKNEGIRFPTEIRVVGSYTDRLLSLMGEFLHFSWEIFYQSPTPSLKRRILFSDLEELLPTYYQSFLVIYLEL